MSFPTRRSFLQLATTAMSGLLLPRCGEDGLVRRVTFRVLVGGVQRDEHTPLVFTTSLGWTVTLESALISIGPVYARNAAPSSGTSLVEGRAVAQVLSIFTIDALNPMLRELPIMGDGVTETARSGEVRLAEAMEGPIAEREGVGRAVASVAGSAERDGTTVRFDGALSLPMDRTRPDYQSVIDHQVQNIPVEFMAQEQGSLVIRVDPQGWFNSISFDALEPVDQPIKRFDERASRLALRAGLGSVSTFDLTWLNTQ